MESTLVTSPLLSCELASDCMVRYVPWSLQLAEEPMLPFLAEMIMTPRKPPTSSCTPGSPHCAVSPVKAPCLSCGRYCTSL